MTTVDYIFLGFALGGGGLFVLRLVLFFIGGAVDVDGDFDVGDVDVGDVDVGDIGDVGDADVGDVGEAGDMDDFSDSDASFRLFSLQALTAFFMVFGLAGLAFRKEAGLSEPWAIAAAIGAGVAAMFLVAKIMQMMMGLQSSGTLNLANAVGQEGSVYLTIPGTGRGKVQVVVQGRLKVLEAVSKTGEDIKTGERIKVVAVADHGTMVVIRGT